MADKLFGGHTLISKKRKRVEDVYILSKEGKMITDTTVELAEKIKVD